MTFAFESNSVLVERRGPENYLFTVRPKFRHLFRLDLWSLKDLTAPDSGEITSKIIKATKVSNLVGSKPSRNPGDSYQHALAIFEDIGTQITKFKEEGLGLAEFTPKDIMVIDIQGKRRFLFMALSKLRKITNGMVELDRPPKKNNFFSPELLEIRSLPTIISWKSAYYNLAALVSAELTGSYNRDKGVGTVAIIYATKLYWAIGRCLLESPDDRYFLII